jgi:hypothetical protein
MEEILGQGQPDPRGGGEALLLHGASLDAEEFIEAIQSCCLEAREARNTGTPEMLLGLIRLCAAAGKRRRRKPESPIITIYGHITLDSAPSY